MKQKTKEVKKQKNQKKEVEIIKQEPKPFKKGDIVDIIGGLHADRKGEIFDTFIMRIQESKYRFKDIILFEVIIDGCFVEKIEQDFLELSQ